MKKRFNFLFTVVLAVAPAAPVFAGGPARPAGKSGTPPAPEKCDTLQVLEEALDHLQTARKLLSDADTDPEGAKTAAERTTDEAMRSVNKAMTYWRNRGKEMKQQKIPKSPGH